MSKYTSELFKTLTPYTPGEQAKAGIKLNTNENAYGPSPKVAEAAAKAISKLNLYPEPESLSLRKAVCAYLAQNLTPENIFMGNGSDEVLSIAFLAFLAGGVVSAPELTYSFYPVYSRLYQVKYQKISMKPEFNVDTEALINTKTPVILANPNAPTSRALPLSEIERMAASLKDRLLIVDEAYVAFGGESAVCLLNRFDNLLIINTLSKSHGLAGLRIGYAVGSPSLIAAMTTVKNCINSYPLDRLAQAGGIAALSDTEYFARCREKIINTREWFSRELELSGFSIMPSAANFVFVSYPGRDGAELYESLYNMGILVRRFDGPLTRDWLRISIGTQSDMEIVAKSMKSLTA